MGMMMLMMTDGHCCEGGGWILWRWLPAGMEEAVCMHLQGQACAVLSCKSAMQVKAFFVLPSRMDLATMCQEELFETEFMSHSLTEPNIGGCYFLIAQSDCAAQSPLSHTVY